MCYLEYDIQMDTFIYKGQFNLNNKMCLLFFLESQKLSMVILDSVLFYF